MRALIALFFAVLLSGGTGVYGADCGDGAACACGDVLAGHYRLPADLGPCPADGLRLRGGAVLDCDGHAVRGTADGAQTAGSSRTVGIILDRTVGAMVRRCTVTNFHKGVEFREAERSTLLESTVQRNGDFHARVGYGVHLNRSRENRILDCTVRDNADEGIHVGTGSDNNVLIGNSVYDNGRENLYVLHARGTRIERNRAGGKVSAALYMKHATASRVEGNRFEDRPVVIRGRSSGNVFTDNIFGAGLRFQAYADDSGTGVPTGNVVRGGRLAGTGTCLSFVDSTDNRIEDTLLTDCKRIAAYSEQPTTNRIVGMPLEGISLDLTGGATLRLLERVHVEVVDASGAPVSGVAFEIRTRIGEAFEGPRTDAAGIAELIVPTHVVSPTHLMPLTPVDIRLRADGYAPRNTVLTDPFPRRVTLTVEPVR